jgi:dipeptidyl aminopeptidase/acylaminoacyl peptidase
MFSDLRAYAATARLTSLRLAPDGTWLAATVQTVAGEPPAYVTSIWRIPTGPGSTGPGSTGPGSTGPGSTGPGSTGPGSTGPGSTGPGSSPARLTRSAEGEGVPEFLSDGSLLFASRRPAAAARSGDAAAGQDKPGLWLLPAAGGEARRIAAPPGGVAGVAAARDVAAFACSAAVFPGASSAAADAARRKARADAGVHAILHETGLLRTWDHDLGPDELHVLAGQVPAGEDDAVAPAGVAAGDGAAAGDDAAAGGDAAGGDQDGGDQDGGDQDGDGKPAEPRDLTPDAGRALDEQSFELTPDGSAVVAGWLVPQDIGEWRGEVVVVDAGTGARRTLLAAAAAAADYEAPRVAPDGRQVVAIASERDTYDRPGDVTLVVVGLDEPAAGAGRDLLAGFDRHPAETAWAADSASVFFTADDQGRRPVFRVAVAGGGVTRVTPDAGDDGAYESLCPSPDGRYLYALRSAVDAPPAPVRIDLARPGAPEPLAGPGGCAAAEIPGRLEEVLATAADGTTIRGWLALPAAASAESPAPLLLWVHGGPLSSWNAWSWRWNPWLMTARGYAVLLPDPALSTGYGQLMIQRGHGAWGENPFTDVMAITDAVVERPDIDEDRTAMMGGSFGGYMANWIAGHTGRFRAIVSHAGVWALDQMFTTTDWPAYWRRTFGDPATQPERYRDNSPHRHVASIATPMLVIHGDKDYRVPVGEALRMWADLASHAKPARFLYFPDENHWILKPGDVPVWYETVLAFLAEQVLGEPWQRPQLL